MFTLQQLQEEQRPWVLHNFGERPTWMPLMGLCEELAELVEAATGGKKLDDYEDAIADCVIFASDYCSAMGWSLQEVWDTRHDFKFPGDEAKDRTRKLLLCVGKMQHHHLKAEQGIRGTREHHGEQGRKWLARLLFQLSWITTTDILILVWRTWAEVSKRDWVAHRAAAAQ